MKLALTKWISDVSCGCEQEYNKGMEEVEPEDLGHTSGFQCRNCGLVTVPNGSMCSGNKERRDESSERSLHGR